MRQIEYTQDNTNFENGGCSVVNKLHPAENMKPQLKVTIILVVVNHTRSWPTCRHHRCSAVSKQILLFGEFIHSYKA